MELAQKSILDVQHVAKMTIYSQFLGASLSLVHSSTAGLNRNLAPIAPY